jgi:hypothetical protein
MEAALVPKLAMLLALAAIVGMLLSALMGVSDAADYLLTGVEICLVLAAVLMIGHVIAGVLADARDLKSASR